MNKDQKQEVYVIKNRKLHLDEEYYPYNFV